MSSKIGKRLSGYLLGAGLTLAMVAFVPAAFAQGGAGGGPGATTKSYSVAGSPGGPRASSTTKRPVAVYPNNQVNAPGAPATGATMPETGGNMGWGNASGAGSAAVGAGHPIGYGAPSAARSATARHTLSGDREAHPGSNGGVATAAGERPPTASGRGSTAGSRAYQ